MFLAKLKNGVYCAKRNGDKIEINFKKELKNFKIIKHYYKGNEFIYCSCLYFENTFYEKIFITEEMIQGNVLLISYEKEFFVEVRNLFRKQCLQKSSL